MSLIKLCEKCGAPYGACNCDTDAHIDFLGQRLRAVTEENNRLREALYPRPEIKDTCPVILYFGTKEDRDEFIAAVAEAKPNMESYKI